MRNKYYFVLGIILIILISGCQTKIDGEHDLYSADGIRSNARLSGNPNLCFQIVDEDYKDFCLAVARNDISLCENIINRDVKDRCFFELWPLLDSCDKIENNDYKGECLLDKALDSQDSSICAIIPDLEGVRRSRQDENNLIKKPDEFRDNCYLGIRLKTNNTELCEQIVEDYLKEECLHPKEQIEIIK